jgi:hypothetical protein
MMLEEMQNSGLTSPSIQLYQYTCAVVILPLKLSITFHGPRFAVETQLPRGRLHLQHADFWIYSADTAGTVEHNLRHFPRPGSVAPSSPHYRLRRLAGATVRMERRAHKSEILAVWLGLNSRSVQGGC